MNKAKYYVLVLSLALLSLCIAPMYSSAFSEDKNKEPDELPVISLYMAPDDLFDKETGIYTPENCEKKGPEWERPVRVRYTDKAQSYETLMGIRISGHLSRTYDQKSFRLISRNKYSTQRIQFPMLFSDDVINSKSVVLRNGGTDYKYAKIRNPFLQHLVQNRAFLTQKATPVNVYLNDEYWGCYTLTEYLDEHSIADKYDLDVDNIVIIKNGELESGMGNDIDLFYKMTDYVIDNDMSVSENYIKASEMLDIDSFVDYCAFETYIYDQDGVLDTHINNSMMWRARTTSSNPLADGKWRTVAFDVDCSAGFHDNGDDYDKDFLTHIFSKEKDEYKENSLWLSLFVSLMDNKEFRQKYIDSLCDMRNICFEQNTVNAMLTAYYETYHNAAARTIEKYDDTIDEPESYWGNQIGDLYHWLTGRNRTYLDTASSHLNFEKPVEVAVNLNSGCIKINNDPTMFKRQHTGQYFSENGLSVTAISDNFKKFDHWDVQNGTADDIYSASTRVYPEEGCTVKAVYK